jgi:hypothetical protein
LAAENVACAPPSARSVSALTDANSKPGITAIAQRLGLGPVLLGFLLLFARERRPALVAVTSRRGRRGRAADDDGSLCTPGCTKRSIVMLRSALVAVIWIWVAAQISVEG